MIAYSELLKISSPSQQFAWTDRGTMLYALAIGLGRHPLDPHFGGPTSGMAAAPTVPRPTPDLTVDHPTRPDQALLYRLLGDRNPLHIDPEAARRAGFERPILHGLCTYGTTCLVVLESCAGFAPERIVSHSLRFSAPVWPGDTLSVDLWRDADIVSFEVRAKERGTAVVRNGRTVLK